jgi:uncharacterized protein with von Willebrand factor type A (vWA) domain
MPADELATTYEVNLAALAASVGQRLHQADMPVTPHQSVQFARALQLANPSSRRELYNMTRAIFVTDVDQVATFDRVFREIFGAVYFTGAGQSAVQARRDAPVAHA